MPYAIAITRLPRLASGGGYRTAGSEPPPSLDLFLTTLTSILGVTAFDVRTRLAGDAPWVVARTLTEAEADATVSTLRDAGFGAVHCDVVRARAWAPAGDSTLVINPTGLTILPAGVEVEYAAVRALLVATLDAERQTENVARVVVARNARGQPVHADMSSFRYDRTQQRALYLVTDGDRPLVRLAQESCRLLDVRGTTSRERFDRLIAAVRGETHEARYDDRLVARPRRRSSYANVVTEGERRGAVTTNVAETDLAVWLLARALAERQIG